MSTQDTITSDNIETELPNEILVVEDSLVQAEIIRRTLAEHRYAAAVAHNGTEALGLLEQRRFALVLLDLTMPGLSGLEVLAAIRKLYSLLELPVIIVTRMRKSDEVVSALQNGANDYVTKPLDVPVFLARIETHLAMSRQALAKPAADTDFSLQMTPDISTPPTTDASDTMIGRVLGKKYRLEAMLGSGGFGVVYRAKHLGMNKFVAIKVLPPQFTTDADRAKLQREAEAACRIQHPNAVLVHDVDVVLDEIPYIVMELLEGTTLDQYLQEKTRLPPERCAEILLPVCDVLVQAHAAGVIHRDLKPGNIYLHNASHGEVIKVLDFGTAKMISEFAGSGSGRAPVTKGNVMGTPEFVAPERLRNQQYDGKVDVYSLGIILYLMLTGELPFVSEEGDTVAVAMMQIKDAPKPLREIHPDIPPEVEAVVLRALEKESDDRCSVRQLAHLFAAAAIYPVDRTLYPHLDAAEGTINSGPVELKPDE